MANSETIRLDVFFDYSCPYVWGSSVWLRAVKASLGDRLQLNWRYFPLEQVNSAEGPEWKIWEQPDDYVSRGRPAMRASLAARQQGIEAFERFHYGLLDAKHNRGEDHTKRETLIAVATKSELDLDQFERDFADRSLLPRIGEDYTDGRERLGVFGTPTLVFPNGTAAYIKMLPPAPAEEAVAVFEDVIRTVRDRPYISEIKRPKLPTTS